MRHWGLGRKRPLRQTNLVRKPNRILVNLVWTRYCFFMSEHDCSARVVAELIYHLGRLTTGDGLVSGLTAAQWTTLRFIGSANRFSRTVSAFAEFHSTTRGTASQTVKGLFSEGYLRRTQSDADGRVVRLDLTAKGQSILRDDPFEALVEAVGIVPPGAREKLISNLDRMLGYVANRRGKRPFGKCHSCAHLECKYQGKRDGIAYACSLMGEPLESAELDEICVNFEQRKVQR